MKSILNKKSIERYSRQIILKNIGPVGQKKIIKSKVLVIGAGGLGCPVIDYLSRAGVGNIGIIDHDNVDISNIHRQSLYNTKDIGKSKVIVLKKKIKLINPLIKIKIYKEKIEKHNIEKIFKNYDYIVDGSDNFKTKFLLNEYSLKCKKILILGAISKMDGHIFTFDFKNKTEPCLKCFYQIVPSDDILNCEHEGILGPVAGTVGNIQAIEVLKKILNIEKKTSKKILILDLLNLKFRKVEFNKKKKLYMQKILIILFLVLIPSSVIADKINYYVSLKYNKVHVRYGPSFNSPIKYIYKKKYLPLKVIDKKEHFRKTIDLKKNSGWIHKSQLIKSKSLITTSKKILYRKPSKYSEPLAKLEEGRLLILKKCVKNWCKIVSENYSGWVETESIWGI